MIVRNKILILSALFALCGFAAVITDFLQERADENIKPADLYAVVERQLGNFQNSDFPRAYEDASRAIQARFSVDQFAAMVQTEYPDMTHVSLAEYGYVEARGSHATLQVFLIGTEGQVMPCVYMMVREGDSWHIDGARLEHPWPPDVRMEGTAL